ncbi:hypothetical protein MD588_22330 [Photobacterium sp. SDRW27]|uniref:hypothetical protein n=1 Tax=Photobacterium obscurum TaxID=2829490 RepID=UPI002244EC7B|nr:hypothetical protein [Photobacterium obscurum]MCW8331538.1 hypothetical protein [Photobacterium obscurum]
MLSKTITLTGGNIRNNHIYLTSVIDMFPQETIGGSNKALSAPVSLNVEFEGTGTAVTDIDGEKKLFRNRSLTRHFFEKHGLVAGDQVSISRLSDTHYYVSPL